MNGLDLNNILSESERESVAAVIAAGPYIPQRHVIDVVMADVAYMSSYKVTTVHVTWTEFITSPTGNVIVDSGVPVDGPRQERYNDTSEQIYLPGTLGIKRLVIM